MSDLYDSLIGALADIPNLDRALCKFRHHLFDEAQPGESDTDVERRQAFALRLCAACPELQRCRDYLDSLPPAKKPGGVIAGQIRTWKTTTRERKKKPA